MNAVLIGIDYATRDVFSHFISTGNNPIGAALELAQSLSGLPEAQDKQWVVLGDVEATEAHSLAMAADTAE